MVGSQQLTTAEFGMVFRTKDHCATVVKLGIVSTNGVQKHVRVVQLPSRFCEQNSMCTSRH